MRSPSPARAPKTKALGAKQKCKSSACVCVRVYI